MIHLNMAPMSPPNCFGSPASAVWEKAIHSLERTSRGYLEPATLQPSNFHYYRLSTYDVLQVPSTNCLFDPHWTVGGSVNLYFTGN